MALASKEQLQKESAMAIIQASAFYDQDFGGASLLHTSSNNFTVSNSSTVSSPSSTNSNACNSVITLMPESAGGFTGSLLSFHQANKRVVIPTKIMEEEEENDYPIWGDDHNLHHPNSGVEWGWLNDHNGAGGAGAQQIGPAHKSTNNKRASSTGENLQAVKKQCVVTSKKAKTKSAVESKDPQSVAAKNRRERISERLKTLQELVPNGSKVDLVTMLEKAISYVKFLQLQVKVLAADEFWPAQGGKAPDLSQVREAIDAILASQRDRSSTSK